MSTDPKEQWGNSEAYELYVGRWSRIIAGRFLAWLSIPANRSWGDIGCGTGELARAIVTEYEPSGIVGIDRSQGYLSSAGQLTDDERVHFRLGDATDLPLDANTVDAAISGLVLNFVNDHEAMVREMARITRSDGIVAVYVWDYSGDMQMMRHFWDAAIDVSPDDAAFDQGNRFPICRPGPLTALFEKMGLVEVSTTAIDILTLFKDFDDYWSAFLGKQGSAPTYLSSVDDDTFVRIRETLRSRLGPEADGTIQLTARAWAVKGTVVK